MDKQGQHLQEYLKSLADMQRACAQSNNSRALRDGWKYVSMEELYLNDGHLFGVEPLTVEEKDIIRKYLPKDNYRMKECYSNAAQISIAARPRFQFCEGFAIGRGLLPVRHAWVELNGKPIDLTWRDNYLEKPTRDMDKLLARIEYNIQEGRYWGIKVPEKVLHDHLMKAKRYSPVVEGARYTFDLLRTGVSWVGQGARGEQDGQQKGVRA